MRTKARFPNLAEDIGHYESFYLKAAHPAGGKAVWIRHTIHRRPGEEPVASIWFTWFDADAGGPRATKVNLPASELEFPSDSYIQVGAANLAPGTAQGRIGAQPGEAEWNLRFETRSEALYHLPHAFLYRSRLPKTKLLSPYPCARFSGDVRIGEERFEIDSWPGMVGHNWGAEHAERWIWIQAADIAGVADDYLDIAIGRVKVGPGTSPWVANGRLVLDGVPHRLGGFRGTYGTEIEETPSGCEFTVPGKNVNVKGKVSAPAKDFVAWIYADPKGPEHHALNCSIADLELRVERPHERHAQIEVAGSAVYELGTRDTDHGLSVQPFADGELSAS